MSSHSSIGRKNLGEDASKTPVKAICGVARLRWRRIALACICVFLQTEMARAERHSLKCEYAGSFYVTLDFESGRVIEETLSGRELKGRIDGIDGDSIHFRIFKPGVPDFIFRLDRRTGRLEGLASPAAAGREGGVFQCFTTELRPVLSDYDSL